MGFNFRKTISIGKHLKANVGKNGLNSFTVKVGPVSYNTKTHKTSVRIAKGLSYKFGGKKK